MEKKRVLKSANLGVCYAEIEGIYVVMLKKRPGSSEIVCPGRYDSSMYLFFPIRILFQIRVILDLLCGYGP